MSLPMKSICQPCVVSLLCSNAVVGLGLLWEDEGDGEAQKAGSGRGLT